MYDIKYHMVWVTKYRKAVLTGQIARRAREVIRGACEANDVKILAGCVSKDHVHLLVSAPPRLLASKLAQYVKGATSKKPLMEHKELNQRFWGRRLWGRGYFVASSGNVTDKVIAEHIRNQDMEAAKKDNFEISKL